MPGQKKEQLEKIERLINDLPEGEYILENAHYILAIREKLGHNDIITKRGIRTKNMQEIDADDLKRLIKQNNKLKQYYQGVTIVSIIVFFIGLFLAFSS